MKFPSLFKFKSKNFDIHSLLESIFDSVELNLFSEFQKEIYHWYKSDSVKHYECFIFSKFLIDYSFPISYKDLDKNVINAFNKENEEVFIQLHEKKYSKVFSYKDLKSTVDEKYNLFSSLRKENKPPECWHLIYSSLTGKNMIDEIQSDITGLKKAIKSLKTKPGLNDLISKFDNMIDRKSEEMESFDLAEILFRQNIRYIKKQLTSIDIPKQITSKK